MTLKEIFEKEVKSKNQQSTDVELLFLTSNEHYINWLEKSVNRNQAKADKWERACEEYDSYAGTNGFRDIDNIMEEDDIDNEDEAEEVYNEEREGWLDYLCMPFTRFDEERLSGYHLDNQYEDEISEIETEK